MKSEILRKANGKYYVKLRNTVMADIVNGKWVQYEFDTKEEALAAEKKYKRFNEGK
ncbi:hypothetical protein [Sporosarcina sp. FSL W7-1283]|uniref:hypothetical protein n=1 Tax=Sporosarcina sp. FSL W7-1283 TaxID=2921560 RepID=UPI0030F61C86